MNSKFMLLALVIFTLFLRSNSSEDCVKSTGFDGKSACGKGCTGTPSCAGKTCGNVDNMCYCNCDDGTGDCRTSDLGYKWNGGVKLANGSYALNGTKGDGKQYKC
jgi:hypothetical protein